jgi:imidazolonepropionase-like amidohydrolase
MMDDVLILENAVVLDVADGSLAGEMTIVTEGSRILHCDRERVGLRDARRIDVKGRTVMPGLCDAHVHVTACTADFKLLSQLSPSYVAAQALTIMNGMLMRGFTTVRDAGGADHGLARAIAEGLAPGPRLLFCEKAISQTGGHGDMRTPGEDASPEGSCCAGLGVVCDGVDEVRRACRDAIRKGATHIKLMASGGVSSPTDRITSTQLAHDELRAAVEEAEAAEIYCMAHAYTPKAMQRALNAGVRSIEHGNFLDEATAAALANRQAFLVPTLSTYDALSREGRDGGLPEASVAKLNNVFAAGLRSLEIAKTAGVTVVFGTDLLGAMHRHQLSEFTIRSQVLSPLELVQSATSCAARLFGLEHDIGSIAPERRADMIVVDGNPAEEISVLCDPHGPQVVIAGGRLAKNAL